MILDKMKTWFERFAKEGTGFVVLKFMNQCILRRELKAAGNTAHDIFVIEAKHLISGTGIRKWMKREGERHLKQSPDICGTV